MSDKSFYPGATATLNLSLNWIAIYGSLELVFDLIYIRKTNSPCIEKVADAFSLT